MTMNKNVFTLTTTDWEQIGYNWTSSDAWFSFRADSWVYFTEIANPAANEQIPLPADTRFMFDKPTMFFVKGAIGTNIYLTPFDK